MIFRKSSESSTTRTRLDGFSNLHLNKYKPDSDRLVAHGIHHRMFRNSSCCARLCINKQNLWLGTHTKVAIQSLHLRIVDSPQPSSTTKAATETRHDCDMSGRITQYARTGLAIVKLIANRHWGFEGDSLLGIDFVEFPGPRDRRRVALILGISRVAKCRALALNN